MEFCRIIDVTISIIIEITITILKITYQQQF